MLSCRMASSRNGNHPIALYLEPLPLRRRSRRPRHMTFLIVFQRSSMLHSFLGSMDLFSTKGQTSCTRLGRLRRCILPVTRMTLIPFTSVTRRTSRFRFPCRTLGKFHTPRSKNVLLNSSSTHLHTTVLMISWNLTLYN